MSEPVLPVPPPPPSDSVSSTDSDIADIFRAVIRWALTLGAASAFLAFVLYVSFDLWIGGDPVDPAPALEATTISLSLTFGSAFIGWFGLTEAQSGLRLVAAHSRREKVWRTVKWFFTTLDGGALLAMAIYLVAGAIAGLTYITNESAPRMLVTVATAWAAQTSAILASTLAKALSSD